MLRDHEKAPSPRPAALGPSSLGIGIYPDHDRDPSVLIRLADKAMCDAKQAGRNGYRLYPPKAG